MLDLKVSQVRYEEMLREAEKSRRVNALLQNRQPSQRGIMALLNRTFGSARHTLVRRANDAQPVRMRSRNT